MNGASFSFLSIQLKLFKKIPTTPRFSTNPERRLHLPFKGLGKKCILPSRPYPEWGLKICPWMEWMEVPNERVWESLDLKWRLPFSLLWKPRESKSWTLMPPTLYCSYSETLSLKWVSKASMRLKNQLDSRVPTHQPIIFSLQFFRRFGLFCRKPSTFWLTANRGFKSPSRYLRESENL